MISEMLKVRHGRIRRILARSSILVRNGLRNKRPGFRRLCPLQKVEDVALDAVGHTLRQLSTLNPRRFCFSSFKC